MSFVSALFPIHTLGGQKSLLNHVSVSRCFLLVGGEGRGLVSLEEASHTPPESSPYGNQVQGQDLDHPA